MNRSGYSCRIIDLVRQSDEAVLGALTRTSDFAVEDTQRAAWLFEIAHLRSLAPDISGLDPAAHAFFEYAIPRMGRRVDVLLIIGGILFVLEYKVGERSFTRSAFDQVTDYFHEASHARPILPVLIATAARSAGEPALIRNGHDGVYHAVGVDPDGLMTTIHLAWNRLPVSSIDADEWAQGRYQPTPTIVEAATALYAGHNVKDLSRSDAGATNLAVTGEFVERVIADSQQRGRKALCLITGVPGAGKTLVGLDVATHHTDPASDLYSVFLSGNGPLVRVLHEALARDRVALARQRGMPVTKGQARSEVKAFIQNVHHFRDEGLKDRTRPPIEHVALFDEAQRAWNREQTANFMRRKRGIAAFDQSEPAFLLSCMDRHPDWAVVVCLVGGGQEINTGEAGISAWLEAARDEFAHWRVFAAPTLLGDEHGSSTLLRELQARQQVTLAKELHLAVSMRSFRAESLNQWVQAVLDGDAARAARHYQHIARRYPIVLTRDFDKARQWTRNRARGSERYGLVVSSQAQRLKPYAIDVRAPVDPVHWFLNEKDDVRSSYFLEDAATEFHVQGLELDWTCVAWDADLRRTETGWKNFSFRGNRWERIRAADRQRHQINAYRVLLTRARQGMTIVVPRGDRCDATRLPAFYDQTYDFLKAAGLDCL